MRVMLILKNGEFRKEYPLHSDEYGNIELTLSGCFKRVLDEGGRRMEPLAQVGIREMDPGIYRDQPKKNRRGRAA